jgi:hypothetical protein
MIAAAISRGGKVDDDALNEVRGRLLATDTLAMQTGVDADDLASYKTAVLEEFVGWTKVFNNCLALDPNPERWPCMHGVHSAMRKRLGSKK